MAASGSGKNAIVQRRFDRRISTLAMPIQKGPELIKRGYMIWDEPITGYSTKCALYYLYNLSTVEADYAISDSSAQASLVFPNAHDQADLRIPPSQTVQWSILFDRTYEMWGSYSDYGYPNPAPYNDPRVVGVEARRHPDEGIHRDAVQLLDPEDGGRGHIRAALN
jgi:hypothetical protein